MNVIGSGYGLGDVCAKERTQIKRLRAVLESVSLHPDVPELIRSVIRNELDRDVQKDG